MNDDPTTAEEPNDVDSARRNVARAEARLSNRWRAAKLAGEKTVDKAFSVGRPVLIGAVAVGGVAWLVSTLTHRGRAKVRRASAPTEPSLLGEVARAAALALASTAARRLAERWFDGASLPPAAQAKAGR